MFKMTTKTENCSNIKQNKNVKYMKINLTAKKQSQHTKSQLRKSRAKHITASKP